MTKPQSVGLSCQLVLGATEALSRARALLERPTPQNLDIACSPLAEAIAQMTGVQPDSTVTASRDLGAALAGLRVEIDLVSKLLESAAGYHVNLIQRMIAASGAPLQQDPCTGSARHLSLEA